MGNPIFNNQGNMPQNNMFGPFGNAMNFATQLTQFAQGLQGNPQQMVQQLMQNGTMTQEQFNQYSNFANSVMPFLPPFMRR